MHEAEVIGSFSCSTHHWLLDQKSAFLLYRVCMTIAICKQLKKNGRHLSFVARFRQNDEDSTN
jgi:hypothetical protein